MIFNKSDGRLQYLLVLCVFGAPPRPKSDSNACPRNFGVEIGVLMDVESLAWVQSLDWGLEVKLTRN